ncbi:hypothetical protein [Colwellia sp. E2M01]|uniref:hypothetical protein n=1 Tax=Colwellia sp. E2M01 TaxID=2841561 RepID=UPI001C07FA3A|nr:hypothetical protein [Colwellia sp. E2M01]MBU2871965.1 hypothetical protein [Colwellia sp. E2M01]
MRNLLLTAAALSVLMAGCSSKPSLYSAVTPLKGGELITITTAISREEALLKANTNAENYCEYKQFSGYEVNEVNTIYQGLYENEKAAQKVKKGEQVLGRFTAGMFRTDSKTDFKTDLSFRCI